MDFKSDELGAQRQIDRPQQDVESWNVSEKTYQEQSHLWSIE
jgi:hypothetical protein